MTNKLDMASIQSQLNKSLFKAIDSLKVPFCDEACQKDQSIGTLQNKLNQARTTNQSAASNLATAEKEYYVAVEGDPVYTASRNRALYKEANTTASKEHDSLLDELTSLKSSIKAVKSMENIEEQVSDVESVYRDELNSKEKSISDAETEMLISQRKAETNIETIDWIQKSMRGWMSYAYFFIVSVLLVRIAFTGMYRTRRGVAMAVVSIALPFITTRMSQFLQMYSPFGSHTTERLRYLYTNGLQTNS